LISNDVSLDNVHEETRISKTPYLYIGENWKNFKGMYFFLAVSLSAPQAFFKVVVAHLRCLCVILIYYKSISPDIAVKGNRSLYFPILGH
jgi:hypothetical protein